MGSTSLLRRHAMMTGGQCGAAPPETLQQVAVVLPNILHKQLLQQCWGALCLLCSFTPAHP